jgi:hypothetical protein
MKLVIDPKDYPNADTNYATREDKKSLLEHGLLSVFDGSWSIQPLATWFSRIARNNSSQHYEHELHQGWFLYSRIGFCRLEETNLFISDPFDPNTSFEAVKDQTAFFVRNSPTKKIFDSPQDIPREAREHLAQMIPNVELQYPDYPTWATSFPIATVGDSIQFYRDSAGQIFSVLNDAFAIQIDFTAWLWGREPTPSERILIGESLS